MCGSQSSGEQKAFNFPASAHGPAVVQQHGYNGNPMINYANYGGNSQGNSAPGAGAQVGAQQGAQQTGAGGNSQNNDAVAGGALAGNMNPQIIPNHGDDSGDHDYAPAFGAIPPQSGGQQNAAAPNYGYIPDQNADSQEVYQGAGAGGAWQGGNNAAPNAAPVAGGAEIGIMQHRQGQESSGMSSGAIAGVVAGVVGVGAVGTAVAVVALKSTAAAASPV